MVTNNSCDYSPTQYNVQTGGANGTLNNVAPSATSGVPVISQGSSSQPVFGTAVVAGGGTGATSFTAYGVISGGTTSTGALQSVTPSSTTTSLLTSGGSAAIPAWKNFSVVKQVFTSNGTYTPTSGMVYCEVICVGSGAGGGGTTATGAGQYSAGGGGGGGEYAVGVFSATTIGASQSVTVGAGGTGVSGASGNDGNTSSLGSLISASGGSKGILGPAAATSVAGGGAGGNAGTGGSYRCNGYRGTQGYGIFAAGYLQGGTGGNSQLGAAGTARINSTNAGVNAANYGAGGGGGVITASTAANAGGNGSDGIVIITEYVIS